MTGSTGAGTGAGGVVGGVSWARTIFANKTSEVKRMCLIFPPIYKSSIWRNLVELVKEFFSIDLSIFKLKNCSDL